MTSYWKQIKQDEKLKLEALQAMQAQPAQPEPRTQPAQPEPQAQPAQPEPQAQRAQPARQPAQAMQAQPEPAQPEQPEQQPEKPSPKQIWEHLRSFQGGSPQTTSPMEKRRGTMQANQEADRAYLERQLPEGGAIKSNEAGFGKQFAMGRLDSDEDIVDYIRDKKNNAIPEGATGGVIKTRTGQTIPGYVLPDDKNFYALNTPGMSKGDAGYAAGKVFNLENLAGIAASFIPIPGAGPLVRGAIPVAKRAATEAVMAGLGRAADETIDTAAGIQDATAGEIGKKSLESTLTGGISSGLSQAGNKLVNTARGARPPGPARPGATDQAAAWRAQRQSAEAVGAVDPSLGELNYSDLWRRINTVNRVINPKAAARDESRRSATLRAFQQRIEEDARANRIPMDPDGNINHQFFANKVTDEALFDIAKQYQIEVKNQLRDKLSAQGIQGGVSKQKGGQTVLDSFYAPGGYNDIKTQEVSTLYDEARQAAIYGKAQYSLAGMREEARELAKKPGVVVGITDPERAGESTIQEVNQITDKEVAGYLDIMKNVKANQNHYIEDGAEITRESGQVMGDLVAIRSRLGEIYEKQVEHGLVDVNGRAAAKMYKIITRTLENPTSTVGTIDVGAAWRKANAAHAEKINTITAFRFGELADQGALGRGERAYEKIKPMMQSMTIEHVDTLKKVMGAEKFGVFKQSYYEDILRDPQATAARISDMSDAEKSLLPEPAREAIQLYSLKLKKLNQDVIVKHLNKLEGNADRVKGIIADLPPDDAFRALDRLKIPRQAYRTAIMADLIQQTTSLDQGVIKMDAKKLINEVKKLRESGHFKNLSEKQQELLNNGEMFSSFLRRTGDVATALNAGAIQAQRVEFHRPKKMLAARAEAGVYAILGWISEQPYIVNRALQTPTPKDYRGLRAGISFATDAYTAMHREASKEELPEFKGVQYR